MDVIWFAPQGLTLPYGRTLRSPFTGNEEGLRRGLRLSELGLRQLGSRPAFHKNLALLNKSVIFEKEIRSIKFQFRGPKIEFCVKTTISCLVCKFEFSI